jgi:hypothetical protein
MNLPSYPAPPGGISRIRPRYFSSPYCDISLFGAGKGWGYGLTLGGSGSRDGFILPVNTIPVIFPHFRITYHPDFM